LPNVDHQVSAPLTEHSQVQAEKLSHPAAGPVSHHGAADPARRRDPKPLLATRTRKRKDHDVTTDDLAAVSVDTLEVRATHRRWQSASATVTG
jgi:hypothetical protein